MRNKPVENQISHIMLLADFKYFSFFFFVCLFGGVADTNSRTRPRAKSTYGYLWTYGFKTLVDLGFLEWAYL